MKSHRKGPAHSGGRAADYSDETTVDIPVDAEQKVDTVVDYSGDNWDDEVLDLLLRDGESKDSVIQAETPTPDSLLKKENDLSRANLSGANLSEVHLNGADLVLAQLSHAELKKAHLAGAHLSYANLQGASLQNVDLNKADLSYADLSQADLREANLQNANLESADLRGADLRGANLTTARLHHSRLPGSLFDESTQLPFEREEAIDLGMVYMANDSIPDIEVT